MLKVLKPSLMTNARDVFQMHLGDPGVDHLVGNEACHFRFVAALAPNVTDLNQGTVVIDNPSQLLPGLHREIFHRVKHQGE